MDLYVQEFKFKTPLETPALQGQIDAACLRGLPEAFESRRLDIVANGPSAKLAPFLNFFDCMALNGSIALFDDLETPPTFWAAVDPQELVSTDFLWWTPHETTYLVASMCHPSVFERLKDRNVLLWHIEDGTVVPPDRVVLPHGTSITLCSIFLALRLGYWDLHIWGWDCCIDPLSGAYHSSGPDPSNLQLRDVMLGSPGEEWPLHYLSTNTLAQEASQAISVIPTLRSLGASITIHGPGLVVGMLDYHASLETPPDAP